MLTLAVIAEAHLGLPETNGVFSGGYAVKLLELGLVDALQAMSVSRLKQSTATGSKLTWLGKYSSMALIPTS